MGCTNPISSMARRISPQTPNSSKLLILTAKIQNNFVTLPSKMAKIFALLKENPPARQKKKQVSLFCARLFVILQAL
jgi:hypothetical protein